MLSLYGNQALFFFNDRAAAHVIDGKRIANEVQLELKAEIDQWKEKDKAVPHLTAILVGENEASKLYIKNKMKVAKSIGKETW